MLHQVEEFQVLGRRFRVELQADEQHHHEQDEAEPGAPASPGREAEAAGEGCGRRHLQADASNTVTTAQTKLPRKSVKERAATDSRRLPGQPKRN